MTEKKSNERLSRTSVCDLVQYRKAKIFILTSLFEGAPNVAAEALAHGCYMITTDIDSSIDITDNGNCGAIFPVNDISALEKVFTQVCNDKELLSTTVQKSIAYAHRNFNWELNIKRLNHMLMKEQVKKIDKF